MKNIIGIGLKDVQNVYSGAEGKLWELIMGEQIHIGGFQSSMYLFKRAGLKAGMSGVDFCCCIGAGMRFLVRFGNIGKMVGVDATKAMIDLGRERVSQEGLSDKIEFVFADVCNNGLPSDYFDFVWGEDAWCYVENKVKLISEASRIIKKDGIIAFTDWIEGPSPLSDAEAERFLKFMKFPNVQDLKGYTDLSKNSGCEIIAAEYTDRFAPYCKLYIDMLEKQLTYDALKIIGFDFQLMQFLAGEMQFMRQLAEQNKIAQGLFIAKKK